MKADVMPEEASYRQIARLLAEAITSGEIPPGTWLPRNLELAEKYDVSLSTLQRALGLLEDRGLVARHQGKGVRVRDPDGDGAPMVPPSGE